MAGITSHLRCADTEGGVCVYQKMTNIPEAVVTSVIENGFSKQLCSKLFPEESSAIKAIEVDNVILPSEVLSKQDHKLYCTVGWGLSHSFRNDCILGTISASSTDNFHRENISNTILDPRDRIDGRHLYWSSEGSEDPEKCETLTYRLISHLCLITEINIQPFQAYFQQDSPIYSAKTIRFRMGRLKSLEDISHVQVVGQTLLPGFDVKYTHHPGKCVVSYTPQGDNTFKGQSWADSGGRLPWLKNF
ncbi:hypothetical protein ACHQM5_008781 [Ranunculus cassubicifolius]